MTVQGPVKKQQPDGMSHGGGGGYPPWTPPPFPQTKETIAGKSDICRWGNPMGPSLAIKLLGPRPPPLPPLNTALVAAPLPRAPLPLAMAPPPAATQDEIIALHIYTAETPIYRIVNEALRKGDQPTLRQWKFFVRAVLQGLAHCPAYEGIAYRGIDAHIDPTLYMPGYVVTWRAFSSATTSAKVCAEGDPEMVLGPDVPLLSGRGTEFR